MRKKHISTLQKSFSNDYSQVAEKVKKPFSASFEQNGDNLWCKVGGCGREWDSRRLLAASRLRSVSWEWVCFDFVIVGRCSLVDILNSCELGDGLLAAGCWKECERDQSRVNPMSNKKRKPREISHVAFT